MLRSVYPGEPVIESTVMVYFSVYFCCCDRSRMERSHCRLVAQVQRIILSNFRGARGDMPETCDAVQLFQRWRDDGKEWCRTSYSRPSLLALLTACLRPLTANF